MRRALRLVRPALAVTVAATTIACGSDAKLPTGPIAATATHYDYKFDVDSRAAHATVTLAVTTAGDCLTLPLRAQSPTNITLDGVAAKPVTTDATSITACGAGYKSGATLTLDADVTFALATLGASQVGYSITNDASGNPFYYLVSWVNGCDQFSPCDNRPDQFATYHFDVTHPATLTVRCPGTITDDSPTETECAFDLDGGPTYSTFGVAAYPAWTQTDKGSWDGVHVTIYDRASTGIAAAIDPVFHTGFIHFMQGQFGPYPFGTELRVLTAPTYWNGFEHPGNIVLADSLAHQVKPPYSNNVAHTLDHEMTHMWAGDQTTLAGTYDFAWKESMAEYLPFVWEDMNDPVASLKTPGSWKTFAMAAKFYPVPGGTPALIDYYADVYGAGPMILFRQLEVMSSRAQVLAAIKSVLGMPHVLSVDELVAALQTQTGIDLTQYAAGWLHGTGLPQWPRFQLTFTQAVGTSTLLVHQLNTAVPGRGCMFHVALHGATPDQVVNVAVDTFHTTGDQTLSVPTPAFTVTSQEIDPLHECLVFLDSSSPRPAPMNPWRSELGAERDREFARAVH